MIPVCIPTIGDKELENVIDCIETNWISSQGKYVEKFEKVLTQEYISLSDFWTCYFQSSATN